MTQLERDKKTLDPLIAQLSEQMTSLGHLTYVIQTLAEHYVPQPCSRVNLVGIYGTLADCAQTFHRDHMEQAG